MTQPYIIALSSYGGGGKTTLARHLVATLNASLIAWDDYDEAGMMTHPDDWVAATTNDWKVPQLGKDLARLKQGQAINSPLDGSSIQPTPYIVFDAPLGYAHKETGQHIDFLVFIDTPLDVAMARRILRDYFADKETLTAEQTKALKAEMQHYLKFSRAAFLNMDTSVKPQADLIVNGLKSTDDLSKEITKQLEVQEF
jgi:uridine kinase